MEPSADEEAVVRFSLVKMESVAAYFATCSLHNMSGNYLCHHRQQNSLLKHNEKHFKNTKHGVIQVWKTAERYLRYVPASQT